MSVSISFENLPGSRHDSRMQSHPSFSAEADLTQSASILRRKSSFNSDNPPTLLTTQSSWGSTGSLGRRRTSAEKMIDTIPLVPEGTLTYAKSSEFSGASLSPSRKKMGVARLVRSAVLNSFDTPIQDVSSPVQCHHIGALALAFTYLLRGKMETPSRSNLVTPEDIFFCNHLPLHYISKGAIALDELYDIAKNFLEVDSRFSDRAYVLEVVHMDTVLKNGNDVLSDVQLNECGERGPRQSMAHLRRMLHDELADPEGVIVVNYDTYTVEQSLIVDESSDDESLPSSLGSFRTSFSPSMRKAKQANEKASRARFGGYAVVTDFQPALNNVVLGSVFLDQETHVSNAEVPLSGLYRAMCSTNSYNGRSRGYLKLRRADSDAQLGSPSEHPTEKVMDEDHLVTVPCIYSPELCSGKVMGSTADGIPLSAIAAQISSHLVGAAFALHLIHGQRTGKYGRGMCISDIVRTLKLPIDAVVNHDLPAENVFSYLKEYIQRKGLELEIQYTPVLQKICREDAATSMSISDLITALHCLVKCNVNSDAPNAVILVNFNASVAHNILNLPAQSHWAIITGFDGEDSVLLHDCLPRKYSSSWTIKVDRLHMAVVQHGFIVLSRKDLPAGTPSFTFGEPHPIVKARLENLSAVLPALSLATAALIPLHQCNRATFVTPLSSVCLAFTHLGKTTSVSMLMHALPVFDVNALLSKHLGLNDVCRIANRYALLDNSTTNGEQKDVITARTVHFEFNRARMNFHTFVLFLKENISLREQRATVFYFDRALLPSAPLGGENYALFMDYCEQTDMVTLLDGNPNSYLSLWRVDHKKLFDACAAPCNVTLRRRGYLLFERKNITSTTSGEQQQKLITRGLDIALLPTAHQFRPATMLTASALSFALMALKDYHSPEEIFYASYLSTFGEHRSRASATYAWRDVAGVSLYVLNEKVSPSILLKMGSLFLDAQKLNERFSMERIALPTTDSVDRANLHELLTSACAPSCEFVLLFIYDIALIHKERIHTMPAGVGIVNAFDGTNISVADVDPSHFDAEWTCDVATALTACTSNDTAEYGWVRIGKW